MKGAMMRKENLMKSLNACDTDLKDIKRIVNGKNKSEPFDNLELPKQLMIVKRELKKLEHLIE